jgi:hypothetical protein
MKESKQYTKDKAQKWKKDKLEKAQSFATATEKPESASPSKKNDSDDEKVDKHDFMNAFIKYCDKYQKKSAGKCKIKRSDSDIYSSDSDSNYSNSYTLVALKAKRAKIGISTTEVIGEINENGKKTPLLILIYTSSSISIITKEWTTLGGKFYTKRQGTFKFKLPEFFFNKTVELKVYVYETTVQADAYYDMNTGRDFITELKIVLDFYTQCITWDGIDQHMKLQGGL